MGVAIADDWGNDTRATSDPWSDHDDKLDGQHDDSSPANHLPRLWAATDLEQAKPQQWLARNLLPAAAVTVLVGDEGIGKSLWWVYVVAAVTTGQGAAELGIPAREPSAVLLILTEDEWGTTVRPRLDVAGANLDHITVICTDQDGGGAPVFPRDMQLVHEAQPDLVIVDAFLDTVDSRLTMKDPQQARVALHPWKEAATTTGASIVLLTHTNRMQSASARDRYGITGELRKKARMALYAQADDDGNLVIGPEKSNITRDRRASVFTIRPVPMWTPSDDQDGTVPRLEYIGRSDSTAAELIAQKAAEQQLGDKSAAILADVRNHPDGTRPTEVAARLNLDHDTVTRYLNRLSASDRITRLSRGIYGPVTEPDTQPHIEKVS